MKSGVIIITVLVVINTYLIAQDTTNVVALAAQDTAVQTVQDSTRKSVPYVAWIYQNSDLGMQRGILSGVNDSAISILVYKRDSRSSVEMDYNVRNINLIKLRAKHSKTTGAVIGVLLGVSIGAAIGFTYVDNNVDKGFLFYPGTEGVTVFSALIGGGIGIGVGMLLGSIKTTYHINGKIENYNKYKKELELDLGNP